MRSASSPSTCRGTASRRRRTAGTTRNTGSPPRPTPKRSGPFAPRSSSSGRSCSAARSADGSCSTSRFITPPSSARSSAWKSAAFQPPWYDTSWLHRPDVHGGEVCAGLVSGLIAPQSPETTRWETLWHYLQGGPGVFKGDLYFYRVDADLRDQMRRIDTRICPLYLMTGEYDFSCTPEDTIRTAEQNSRRRGRRHERGRALSR